MSEKIIEKYEDPILVNGSKVNVKSEKRKWNGKDKGFSSADPGLYLWVTVAAPDGEILYREQREITREFDEYAGLKHQQIVRQVRKCKDLEQITKEVGKIF